MKSYHLTKDGNTWNLRPEGAARPVIHADTKVEALGRMQVYMHHHAGSVIIHKENGRIQAKRNYPRNAGPKPTKG